MKRNETKCVVSYCQNIKNRTKAVSFHEFPSDKRWETWEEILKEKELLPVRWNGVKTSTRICSAHFEPEMYFPDRKIRQLRPEAIPTIFEEQEPKRKFPRNDFG